MQLETRPKQSQKDTLLVLRVLLLLYCLLPIHKSLKCLGDLYSLFFQIQKSLLDYFLEAYFLTTLVHFVWKLLVNLLEKLWKKYEDNSEKLQVLWKVQQNQIMHDASTL